MNKTPITPQLLREKGFEEKMMFGKICFVKHKIAVVYNSHWIPCNIETGLPLSTEIAVDTYEELERVVREGDLIV